MIKRVIKGCAVVGGALLLAGVIPSAALAGPPQHEKTIEHNGTNVFVDEQPCTEGFFKISLAYNLQEHATYDDDTSGHFTFTETGTFTASPTNVLLDANGDPVRDEEGDAIATTPRAGVSYSGRFTIWGGGNFSPKQSNETFTFNITGKGSDGSKLQFHDNAHIVTDGPGDPEDPATPIKVAFDKSHC